MFSIRQLRFPHGPMPTVARASSSSRGGLRETMCSRCGKLDARRRRRVGRISRRRHPPHATTKNVNDAWLVHSPGPSADRWHHDHADIGHRQPACSHHTNDAPRMTFQLGCFHRDTSLPSTPTGPQSSKHRLRGRVKRPSLPHDVPQHRRGRPAPHHCVRDRQSDRRDVAEYPRNRNSTHLYQAAHPLCRATKAVWRR